MGEVILKKEFFSGLCAGVPIGLGYLSVSFGFGIAAVRAGLSVLAAVGISATNLTSAGQVAGLAVIAAGGTILEMILTQIIINLRYSLMGISLTQNLDSSFSLFHRLICSFAITDEIFAVASMRQKKVTPAFFYGLMTLPLIGWTAGTFLGAFAGRILPETVSSALGIMIYAMFIAIVVPPARKKSSLVFTCGVAVGCSSVLYYAVPALSSGFAVIISTVIAASASALFFPVDREEETK